MPRLAACHCCGTLTRLPDVPKSAPMIPATIEWYNPQGDIESFTYRDDQGHAVMVAAYDPALEEWMTRHEHPDVPEKPGMASKHDLWLTDQNTWETEQVIVKLKKGLEDATGTMYAERDELKDDAMACFNAHHRPTDSCSDCFTEAKVIGSHESNRNMPKDKRMFLCHLCPFVHGKVIPDARHAKGMYK